MNLDSHINLLKHQMQTHTQQEHLDEQAITQAIHGKATHLAAKVSRAIAWEAGSILLVVALCAAALMWYSHQLIHLIAVLTLVVCIAMAVVYAYKYRQLKQLVQFESNTKQLLQSLIKAVRQFINLYIWMIGLSIVLGFILGGAYGLMEGANEASDMPETLTAWYAIPATLLFMAVVLWACKWYIHQLYGKPLQALEQSAAELEQV